MSDKTIKLRSDKGVMTVQEGVITGDLEIHQSDDKVQVGYAGNENRYDVDAAFYRLGQGHTPETVVEAILKHEETETGGGKL